jgi:hypothetical protein
MFPYIVEKKGVVESNSEIHTGLVDPQDSTAVTIISPEANAAALKKFASKPYVST